MFPRLVKQWTSSKCLSAQEMGVNLKQGYNGDLTFRESGDLGGQMVKKMIEAYESGMQKQGKGAVSAGDGPEFLLFQTIRGTSP